MSSKGFWRVERITREGREPAQPFLITLQGGDSDQVMHFRGKGKWPGPGQNLYLRRYKRDNERDTYAVEEESPLLNVHATHGKPIDGKRVSTIDVAIDRKQRSRCSLFISTEQIPGGFREVVYLRTESGTKGHRSKGYLQPTSRRILSEIVIDSRELYPWAFAATKVTRSALRSGDYALRVDEKIVAVVERKEFRNMLATLVNLESYHAHLRELATYTSAALVIEAQYRDFLDPKKTKPASSARAARALADIAAKHPNLQIVFAGNRKDANVWATHFFEACCALATGTVSEPEPVQESLVDSAGRANTGGLDAELRHAVMHSLPSPLRLDGFLAAFPSVPKARLSGVLRALRDEGKLTTTGRARGTLWHRVVSP